jgi:hypothetical protein
MMSKQRSIAASMSIELDPARSASAAAPLLGRARSARRPTRSRVHRVADALAAA